MKLVSWLDSVDHAKNNDTKYVLIDENLSGIWNFLKKKKRKKNPWPFVRISPNSPWLHVLLGIVFL